MAVSIEDIKKLREMTKAGLSDCKNALNEAEGDMEKAYELIRQRGLAVAAKRSDREAGEGAVVAKAANGFAAIVALKCETDFVAQNADFVKLANDILDLAIANKVKTAEEVLALQLNGISVADAIQGQSGVTGEKMELGGYFFIEGDFVSVYNHQSKNSLCTLVSLNKSVAPEYGHNVAMQVAAMNPVSIDVADVPEAVRAEEFKIAIEKTREEGKPENMVERIAEGRMNKFYQEQCLLRQAFIMDGNINVASYLQQADKELTVLAFKRFTLRAE